VECLVALFIVLVVIVVFFIYGYNRLREMRNVINRTFAQVDTYLQKRANLIPNLVEVTKGYAKHENDVLTGIAASRALSSYSKEAPVKRDREEIEVAKDIKKIIALKEAYPDLKANADFLNLMNELEAVEGQIAEQREAFNNVVKVYNDLAATFPTSLVAQIFAFTPADYFDFGDAARAVVKVDLSDKSDGDEDLIDLGPVGEK
jgi:LemA protein